ncbi:PDR/VanB family oxidoreductase [Nocardia sp. alder85J]|uniref:PDR/VanB family oxidoreductase n=1 Tax=Nocardia sp. alder85J TaxID=2862949 RepID=UPI001CD25F7D|nr:PDR/VanB family oxidoreductase [Nocardia sp. alder85J]MCX4095176.1 PDR/VanB family oxidoreductase [Nocardia sp. alder85J]
MNKNQTLDVVVRDRRTVARDIDEFTLARPTGDLLPTWEPGAHLDLLLDSGAERQYSLCSDPADTTSYRIAVLREPHGRGGSLHAHESLTVGTRVSIRPPRNHFPLVRALGYVFVAGGVGITPMPALLAAAARTGRPWRLVYTGRDADTMAYATELSDRHGDAVTLHHSTTAGRLDLPALLAATPRGTAVYVCGPTGLISAVEEACASLPAVDVFSERFVATTADDATDAPFEVSLANSGLVLTIPAGRSILDIAESHGVVTVSSCREGTCGTCETTVASGEVEHRDSVLSPQERAEGETMMICVSRGTGPRLVLEL